MSYERDDGGSVRCLVCGKRGIGRQKHAMRGHENSRVHKEALTKRKAMGATSENFKDDELACPHCQVNSRGIAGRNRK